MKVVRMRGRVFVLLHSSIFIAVNNIIFCATARVAASRCANGACLASVPMALIHFWMWGRPFTSSLELGSTPTMFVGIFSLFSLLTPPPWGIFSLGKSLMASLWAAGVLMNLSAQLCEMAGRSCTMAFTIRGWSVGWVRRCALTFRSNVSKPIS